MTLVRHHLASEPTHWPRRAFERTRYPAGIPEESLTQQNMAEETDINNIMAKYEKTGLISHVNRFQGDYTDYTEAPEDLHDAMNRVMAAQEMFMTLPANLRKEYENSPAKFLEFVDNATDEELHKAGLLPNELYAAIEAQNAPKKPPAGKAGEGEKGAGEAGDQSST